MQTLTLHAGSNSCIVHDRPPRIYVEGVRRSDLAALRWEETAGPPFGNLLLAMRDLPRRPCRIEHLGHLPPAGTAVRAVLDGREFPGVVAAHRLELTDEGETLQIHVEHVLAYLLRGPIVASASPGTDGIAPPDPVLRFNMDAGTLCSAELLAIGPRRAPGFDGSPAARPWTAAGALAYLVAMALPAALHAPAPAELEALAGDIELPPLDLTGLSAGEAIARVAELAGLDTRATRDGHGLVFDRPGAEGPARVVRLQMAGDAFAPAASNLRRGAVDLARRPARRGVLALGARKQHEATFELHKGWDPARETARWRDFVRSERDDWPAVADVYRKWVLNEHGRYAGAPWRLPTCRFAGVAPADFARVRPRRLLPCLSRDAAGRSLGIVVEVQLAGGPWRRWTGPVVALEHECAIYFEGEGLESDYFAAAVRGEVRVRVTAVVEADARLQVRLPGDAGTAPRVESVPARGAWRRVHPSSVFYRKAGLGVPDECDQTALLERIAARARAAVSRGAAAELTLGRIDPTFRVGDRIAAIEGRGVSLAAAPAAPCVVESVRHEFGREFRTILHLRG